MWKKNHKIILMKKITKMKWKIKMKNKNNNNNNFLNNKNISRLIKKMIRRINNNNKKIYLY